MLEAANADLVSPSARSAAPTFTSDLHAGWPITPSVTLIADKRGRNWIVRYVPGADIPPQTALRIGVSLKQAGNRGAATENNNTCRHQACFHSSALAPARA